ncbi:MAG: hypothetical protein RLY66_649 [Candidatus Parcubacteria bacterium]|jgi:hypothetical protein
MVAPLSEVLVSHRMGVESETETTTPLDGFLPFSLLIPRMSACVELPPEHREDKLDTIDDSLREGFHRILGEDQHNRYEVIPHLTALLEFLLGFQAALHLKRNVVTITAFDEEVNSLPVKVRAMSCMNNMFDENGFRYFARRRRDGSYHQRPPAIFEAQECLLDEVFVLSAQVGVYSNRFSLHSLCICENDRLSDL